MTSSTVVSGNGGSVAVMPIGTRIYYTGDAANFDGFGEIFAIRPANRWQGESMDVRLDDGREFLGLTPACFENCIGQRFMTAAERKARRDAAIGAMTRAAA